MGLLIGPMVEMRQAGPVIFSSRMMAMSILFLILPQHAIYLNFQDGGLLVRARQLQRLRRLGARQMRGVRQLRYHHFLLPRHYLVRANGIWCESLYPGPMALAGFSKDQRGALYRLDVDAYGPPVARYAKLNELSDVTGRELEKVLANTNGCATASPSTPSSDPALVQLVNPV